MVRKARNSMSSKLQNKPEAMYSARRGEYVDAVVAQVAGTHYEAAAGMCPHCGGEIQHWDLYAEMPYLKGSATKYITRNKGDEVENLEKAMSCIQKRIAIIKLRQAQKEPRNR